MKNLTSLFTIQPNGSYVCAIQGCKGIVKVEFAPSATKDWVKVLHSSSLHTHNDAVYQGHRLCFPVRYPSSVQMMLVCDERPVSVTLYEEESGVSSEVINQFTTVIQEQADINAQQQQVIDANVALDEQQQQQINNNTTIINQMVGGIGEEAAKALVDKVFGQSND